MWVKNQTISTRLVTSKAEQNTVIHEIKMKCITKECKVYNKYCFSKFGSQKYTK